jgi:hypothetical protein
MDCFVRFQKIEEHLELIFIDFPHEFEDVIVEDILIKLALIPEDLILAKLINLLLHWIYINIPFTDNVYLLMYFRVF